MVNWRYGCPKGHVTLHTGSRRVQGNRYRRIGKFFERLTHEKQVYCRTCGEWYSQEQIIDRSTL